MCVLEPTEAMGAHVSVVARRCAGSRGIGSAMYTLHLEYEMALLLCARQCLQEGRVCFSIGFFASC